MDPQKATWPENILPSLACGHTTITEGCAVCTAWITPLANLLQEELNKMFPEKDYIELNTSWGLEHYGVCSVCGSVVKDQLHHIMFHRGLRE